MLKVSLFLLSFISVSLNSLAGQDPIIINSSCYQGSHLDATLSWGDFKWGYSPEDLLTRFSQIYQEERRLRFRAFFNEEKQSILLPYTVERGGAVEVPAKFIKAVSRHIEVAFENKYIDGVFFPDMGHSHLLIPDAKWEEYQKIPVSQMNKMYEGFFSDPEVLVLYHTAEQLAFLDSENKVKPDPYSQWRFATRNLVGHTYPSDNLSLAQNPSSMANTVNGIQGYRWWGAGFNISANKNGCFGYQKDGQIYYFDMSLFDLAAVTGTVFIDGVLQPSYRPIIQNGQ